MRTGPRRIETGPAPAVNEEISAMYDMYPEWGPARHDPDSPVSRAVQHALDLRDNGGERPDDN